MVEKDTWQNNLRINKAKKGLRKVDLFAFRFSLDLDQDDEHETTLGSILSIILLVTTIIFAIDKFNIMKDYSDTRIMFVEIENHFDDSVSVAEEMGFNVAFALSAFDGSSEIVEDPDYATVQAIDRTWGDYNDNKEVNETPKASHLCDQSEIGLGYFDTLTN